jgi:8-oxo-dGTP pyrophosphatase MutT (NUDIX family)
MDERNGPWRVRSSRTVYRNPWLGIREDEVVRPDGTPGIYGVVELPGSIAVLATSETGDVPLVSQWRYPLRRMSLELPTGAIDADDADPLAAARRELLEETGWDADEWHPLGTVDNSNGVSTDTTYLFLAVDAAPVPGAQRSHEDVTTLSLSTDRLPRLRASVLAGEITAAPSVAAILRAEVQARHDRRDPWPRLRVWFDE